MKKIKIMLVDDHEVVINGIRTVLKGVEDIEVIEDACDGDMLLKKLKYLLINKLRLFYRLYLLPIQSLPGQL